MSCSISILYARVTLASFIYIDIVFPDSRISFTQLLSTECIENRTYLYATGERCLCHTCVPSAVNNFYVTSARNTHDYVQFWSNIIDHKAIAYSCDLSRGHHGNFEGSSVRDCAFFHVVSSNPALSNGIISNYHAATQVSSACRTNQAE